MEIQTNRGVVKGVYQDHLYQFKGIIYAKAKRFQKPEAYQYNGVLDCSCFRSQPPQIPKEKQDFIKQSEDCLNLNLYTPCLHKKLPVLIEIYGGAFQKGNNQKMDPVYVVGNDEFVYITINYRVGVLGYLYLEDYPTSGNNGLLDQIEAIRWVYENVEYFGGDPQQITVLGSSAGAKSIAALLTIPYMQKYFQKAILMSGAYQSIRSIETAKAMAQRYLDILQIPVEQLPQLSLSTILEAQKILCSQEGSVCFFGPVADCHIIQSDYMEQLRNGGWQGTVMIGSSKYELAWLKQMPDFLEKADELARNLFGKNAYIALKRVADLKEKMALQDAWIRVFSDMMYCDYSLEMGKLLSQGKSLVYQYSHECLPAYHCMDHQMAFLSLKQRPQFLTTPQYQKLGQWIRQNIIHFVCCGFPHDRQWKSLNQTQSMMIWDEQPYLRKVEEKIFSLPDQIFILSLDDC